MFLSLRFAILWHETPPGAGRAAHWDLLLEEGESLASWTVEAPPDGTTAQPALQIAPHRLLYLDYEGPLSGGRGTVARWDAGVYRALEWSETRRIVRLHGERLQGVATWVRADEQEPQWTFQFAAESAARP